MEGRKKRERRKAFRNKKHSRLSEIQLKEMDCEWDLPPMHKLIGRMNGRPLYRSLFTALGSGSASELVDEFISSPCHRALSELRVQSVCALNTIARQSSQRFRIARIRRIISNSIPTVFGKSHSELMRTFLRKLFTLVFPTELIGARNWDRLIDNFVQALGDMRTRSQLFPYAKTCAGLRYDEIQWLDTVPFALKALVVKHLSRFFSRFVANMLSCHFHVTESSTMRVFIYRIDVWAKIVGYGLQLFIARGKWKMVTRNDDVCTFVLRFIPKGLSVRPVVKFNDSPAVVHRLKQVKAILGYIVATKPWCMAFGMNSLMSFSPAYRNFALQMKRGEGMSLYWAAGDVANCFPSIDHSTLERLLCDLLGTKDFVTLNCWVISKVKSKSGKAIWRKIYSAGPNRHVAGKLLRLRKREAIGSNPSCSRMSAEEVLEAIRQYVLHAHLKSKKALYRSNRGIPQGSSLSWILCNLYLGAMERKIFEHRPRGLFCRRYVDDYIVITNNRRSLVEFGQQLVRESDRGFGIRFNWDKMVVSSNLERRRGGQLMIALRRREKLRWCGQAFNTRTMRVTADYRRYRANPPMLSVPQLHPTEKFGFMCAQAKRLINHRLNSLRLSNDGPLGAKWRRQLNRDLLDFAFKSYFLKFVSALGFEMRDPMVRRFLRQLTRWVSNRFPTRDLPDAALPSLAL